MFIYTILKMLVVIREKSYSICIKIRARGIFGVLLLMLVLNRTLIKKKYLKSLYKVNINNC